MLAQGSVCVLRTRGRLPFPPGQACERGKSGVGLTEAARFIVSSDAWAHYGLLAQCCRRLQSWQECNKSVTCARAQVAKCISVVPCKRCWLAKIRPMLL